MKNRRLVMGIGINDSETSTQKFESRAGMKTSKRIWICPYYSRWKDMLVRCYSVKHHKDFPTYKGCTVSSSWLTFSNFKGWCIEQERKGSVISESHLDKDLFGVDKEYNPTVCAFIHNKVNTFLKSNSRDRGEYPLGVSYNKKSKSLEAWCRSPFVRKSEYLGTFSCPVEAHQAWQVRKHQHACELADSEFVTDERVAKALRERYAEGTIHK